MPNKFNSRSAQRINLSGTARRPCIPVPTSLRYRGLELPEDHRVGDGHEADVEVREAGVAIPDPGPCGYALRP